MNQDPILFDGVSGKPKIPVVLNGEGLELSVLKKQRKKMHGSSELLRRMVGSLVDLLN